MPGDPRNCAIGVAADPSSVNEGQSNCRFGISRYRGALGSGGDDAPVCGIPEGGDRADGVQSAHFGTLLLHDTNTVTITTRRGQLFLTTNGLACAI